MTPNFNGVGAEIQAIEFAYGRSPDQDQAQPVRHPVVIVGAGPVGLSLAIDLAQRGQKVVLLDNDHRLSSGSRAICFAKRTLEIWDRLGVGQRMLGKGVSWNVGKVFFGMSSRSTSSTCCPRPVINTRPSSTCSSITPRPAWWSARCSCGQHRAALAQQGRSA